MQQQFEQLVKEFSIVVTEETAFCWNGEVKKLPLSNTINTLAKDKPYSTAGKVIAYIYKRQMFVTPRTKKAINALRSASYHEMPFFVPLGPEGMSFEDEKLATRWQELITQTNPVKHSAQSLKERRAQLAKSRSSVSTDDSENRWTQPVVAAV